MASTLQYLHLALQAPVDRHEVISKGPLLSVKLKSSQGFTAFCLVKRFSSHPKKAYVVFALFSSYSPTRFLELGIHPTSLKYHSITFIVEKNDHMIEARKRYIL